ncbi:MAG: cation:proton antiporter [Candidatus Accumulibacter sp.]|nr:cation:proton antiporter [Accumulibacter sp.]
MSTLPLVLMLLGACVVSVIIFRRIALPPILGYLLVGALVGPHAFNLVPDVADVSHLAEFGIVFMMFSIGLEFSLPKLFAMKRIVFGLGAAQVLATLLAVTGIAMLAGFSWQAGVSVGGALAMSSTALLGKLLGERLEIDSPHGREVIGVLLFQDLAVVPLLILIPSFSQAPRTMAWLMGVAVVKAAIVLMVVTHFGKQGLSRWFTVVARGKSPELFMLNVLLVTLGLAYLTEMSGLSMALGAFIAGMLISETEFRHEVAEDIKPFRDVLMGLFFVTVGMLLDLPLVLEHLPVVLAILVGLVVVKFAVVFGASRLFGALPGEAMRSGLWLCAGGEFGLVLLSLIRQTGVASPEVVQATLAALVISLLFAPFIVHYSERLVLRFVRSEWMLRSMQLTSLAVKTMRTEKHAVICGFGRNGQQLAQIMGHEGVSFLALDLDPDRVAKAAAAGENVVYGDATRRETLIAAGIGRASVLVVSFADTRAAELVMHHAREIAPGLPIVVRTVDEKDFGVLQRAGAAEIVQETQELSLMLASHALIQSGVPINRVLKRIRQTRGAHYRSLHTFFHGGYDEDENERDVEATRLSSFPLDADAFAVGKSIGELAIGRNGAEVMAVRRRDLKTQDPSPELRFETGDIVVLLGEPEALALAEERLLKG